MRYEIAVLVRALEQYHARTGGYHPVDTATMSAAIEEMRAAYRGKLDTLHEMTLAEIIHQVTLAEIIHARKMMYLATALIDFDRDIALALAQAFLGLRELSKNDNVADRSAFLTTWLDERYRLLDLYGQLLDEERDALFQLAVDALRARGLLPPLPGS